MRWGFRFPFLLGHGGADVGFILSVVVLLKDGPLGAYDAASGHGVCLCQVANGVWYGEFEWRVGMG